MALIKMSTLLNATNAVDAKVVALDARLATVETATQKLDAMAQQIQEIRHMVSDMQATLITMSEVFDSTT